jgi:hypothetical protein
MSFATFKAPEKISTKTNAFEFSRIDPRKIVREALSHLPMRLIDWSMN